MFSTSEGPEVCRDLEIIPQDVSTQMKDANEIQTMTGALLVHKQTPRAPVHGGQCWQGSGAGMDKTLPNSKERHSR